MNGFLIYERPSIEIAYDFTFAIANLMESVNYRDPEMRETVRIFLEGSFVPFYKNGVSIRVHYRSKNGGDPSMYVEIESGDISTESKAIRPGGTLIPVEVADPQEIYHSIERIGNEMQLRKIRGRDDYAEAVRS